MAILRLAIAAIRNCRCLHFILEVDYHAMSRGSKQPVHSSYYSIPPPPSDHRSSLHLLLTGLPDLLAAGARTRLVFGLPQEHGVDAAQAARRDDGDGLRVILDNRTDGAAALVRTVDLGHDGYRFEPSRNL